MLGILSKAGSTVKGFDPFTSAAYTPKGFLQLFLALALFESPHTKNQVQMLDEELGDGHGSILWLF